MHPFFAKSGRVFFCWDQNVELVSFLRLKTADKEVTKAADWKKEIGAAVRKFDKGGSLKGPNGLQKSWDDVVAFALPDAICIWRFWQLYGKS